jgi:D-alanyl-D-alanine carboxypeptidase
MTTNSVTSPKSVHSRTGRVLGRSALVVSLAAVLAGSGAVTAAAAAKHDDMREVVRHTLGVGAPGFMARLDDGRRTTVTAAGVADLATGRRVTGREQFEVGSNTKTFTATLALQLVDRGQLELDAPVERYLPGVVPNGANITVRMLLNHTSGLYSYTSAENFFEDIFADPQHVHTDAELLERAFAYGPYFAPGTGWWYSNTNYVLVGMIVQKLTGKSLPVLVQERIARPLGLTHTYYADPRATSTGRGYAHGYTIKYAGADRTYVDTTGWPLAWGGAAGAIVSNQEDLARFFSALLRGRLFSQEQLAQMKITVPIPAMFKIKGEYGLGLMRKDTPCGSVWGHGGDTNGHHSTAVTTADGRRTAVSDTTISPSGDSDKPNADRYVQLALAAEAVLTCTMLGQPAPAELLRELRGDTPASDPAAVQH